MPILGPNNKAALLHQVGNTPSVNANTILDLVNRWDDLSVDDFKGIVGQDILDSVNEIKWRDAITAWNAIKLLPLTTVAETDDVIAKVNDYLAKYPGSPNFKEALARVPELHTMKRKIVDEEREHEAWVSLDRGNYYACQQYKKRFPDSVHLDELDDLMWDNIRVNLNAGGLHRYLSDWPVGRHSMDAKKALADSTEWDAVKRSGDIFQVVEFRDSHPDSSFKLEIDALYWQLRDEVLAKMKKNPCDYTIIDVKRYIKADIFSKYDLLREGLMSEKSWDILNSDVTKYLPDLQSLMVQDQNVQSLEGNTDIFLFGTPGTGKTCLIMGLAGADGNGYSLNMKTNGGPYASALSQYVDTGMIPPRTGGNFVTTINGTIFEKDDNKTISHKISIIEMSGEEFAFNIADQKSTTLEDMGTGATNILRNSNRKVFFIIVDPTRDKVVFDRIIDDKDENGNIINQRIVPCMVSQLETLKKMVSLFVLPENQDIMRKVDAINFVVTKSDLLGESYERMEKARDILKKKYLPVINQLKEYCIQTQRINYTNPTDKFAPRVYSFSLGKFYLGGVYDFENTETLQLIEVVREMTSGVRSKTFWDRFKSFLNG